MTKRKKIVKFKPVYHLNIALIVCVILLIYLGFHLISYLTGHNVSVYEVTAGTIAQNNHYQALAIRQETVVNSDRSGYPFYYAENGAQAGVLTPVYSMDDTGDLAKKMNADTQSASDVTQDEMDQMEKTITSFSKSYQPDAFQKTYSFYSDLSDSTSKTFHMGTVTDFSDQINAAVAAGTYHVYNSTTPGYLLYSTDGGEGITTDSFTDDDFKEEKYKVKDLRTTEKIDSGTPVYKLITSDNWNLIMKIDASVKKKIGDAKNVRIRFDDDQAETIAGVNYIDKNGSSYLSLSLNDSVDRYANQRLISIELVLDEQSGLKIPNSAITEKSFFVIPKEYFYKGNDSNDQGLMVVKEKGNEFVTPTIYYESDEGYYIDSEYVKKNDEIRLPDSVKTYRVGTKTKKLKGVYNVNKGYAVFNRVDILFQNSDYSVVKNGTSYGVSLYDHIALNGDSVKENQIIH